MEHEEETGEVPVVDADFARRYGRNHQEPRSVDPVHVGIILDSSVIITAERRGHSVRQILETGAGQPGEHRDRLAGGEHGRTDA